MTSSRPCKPVTTPFSDNGTRRSAGKISRGVGIVCSGNGGARVSPTRTGSVRRVWRRVGAARSLPFNPACLWHSRRPLRHAARPVGVASNRTPIAPGSSRGTAVGAAVTNGPRGFVTDDQTCPRHPKSSRAAR